MKFKSFLIAVILLKSVCSYGQTITPGTEWQELVKIADVYSKMPYLSFDVRYTFADTLDWEDIVDSMSYNCKLSYDRSFISNSEIEVLHGSEYNVFVDKEDSFIVASSAASYKDVMQLPLMDSVFRAAHISSMRIDEENDSTWILRVFFNPDSYYFSYDMTYDRFTCLVKRVDYYTRNEGGDYNIPSDHIVSVSVYMTNYSDADQDPATFNENRYIYKLNGSLYLQPAWQQFQFQN